MQKKLKEMYSPADQVRQQMATSQRLQAAGMGAMAGSPDNAGYQRTLAENKRNLDRSTREEKTNLEEKSKKLIQEQGAQKKISEQYQAIVKAGKEDLKIKKDLLDAQESLNKAQKEYEASHVKVNALLNERQRLESPAMQVAPGQTPPPPPVKGVDMGAILKGVGGVLAALGAGAAVYDQYTSLSQTTSRATGSATQGLLGSPLQSLASGDVVNQMAFLPERQKAMQMATDKMHSREMTDMIPGSSILSMSGFGRNFNASAGALTGSLAKSIGQGGYGGMPGAGWLSGKLGNMSESYNAAHQAQLMELAGQDTEANLDAEKKKNPLKNLAAQRLQGNYMQDLNTQRQLGLGYEGFAGRGGFQERANMAGFNSDLGTQMAGQIMGAGGSTRASVNSNVLGLQAQRGFDMTNAGSVLGKISGTAGSSQATDAIFKKLLEESVKAGLDKSEFREEQRKFADITSNILSTSGAKTAEEAEKVLQGFTRFLGKDSTIKELEGARSAYTEQQAFSAETSGRGGALQFAGLMQQPGMGKLGAMGMAGLMEMPEQDLTETNPYIVAEAAKVGKSPKDLISQVMDAKRQKSLVEVGLDPKKMKALNEYMQKNSLDVGTMTGEQINAMPEDMKQAYLQAQEAPSVRSQYESPQKRASVVRGLISGAGGGIPGQEEMGPGTSVEEKLRGPTGRPEDEVVKATGVAAQAMLENFRRFKTEITPASDALDAFTKKIILFASALNFIPDVDKAAAQKHMIESMSENIGPKTQQQGAKPTR